CRNGASDRDNDIHLEADELCRAFSVAFGAALRPSILDRDGATIDPAKFLQARDKRCSPWTKAGRIRAQKAYCGQLARLLRICGHRPSQRAGDGFDEFAPPHQPSGARGHQTSTLRPRRLRHDVRMGPSRPLAGPLWVETGRRQSKSLCEVIATNSATQGLVAGDDGKLFADWLISCILIE